MKSSIKSRWIKNILLVIIAIFLAFTCVVLYSVFNRYFSSAEQTIRARINKSVDTFFASYIAGDDELFAVGAGEFVETFLYKDIMEVWVLDKNGRMIVSSSGFSHEISTSLPDYEEALHEDNGIGVERMRMDSGEPVTAVSYILKDKSGQAVGAVRYLISMEETYHQLTLLSVIIILVVILIILLITLTGMYFVSSIVNPVQKINATTGKIANGDFDVRIEIDSKDEIGELCASINDMAMRLSETDRIKNEFISTVSHEIRTPLTAIKGWGETLQNHGDDKEILKKGLDIIVEETTRLSSMVEELLDFSRMQNNGMTIIKEQIELSSMLLQTCEMYKQKAEAENISLEASIDIKSVLKLTGDYDRIRQVFINILDNAVKYTQSGGAVRVNLSKENNFAAVTFSDTGYGISEEDLKHVKEKFYKANNTIRGTGIGLAVADEITRMHGGQLIITSELGKGTTVKVLLPINDTEDNNE